ncbi:MAG: DUF370 domain-containing protein [Firmicutes bacterium]|nr:DUF370 domain-containing protein [Bacillota bacterium]
MFLHLGGNQIISINEIIIVENLEKTTATSFQEWWQQRAKTGLEIVDSGEGKPKSAVYTGQKIILSPISVYTLKKRSEQFTG